MTLKKFVFFMLAIFILGCGAEKGTDLTEEKPLDKNVLSGLKGEIVFQSDREGNWEIYRL